MKLTRYPSEKRELTGPAKVLIGIAIFTVWCWLMWKVH